MTTITTNVNEAAAILNNGDVIAIPTETVYGLAANIYNEEAIKKIFQLKKRPLFNPLIVHIQSIEYLDKVAINVPEKAMKLAQAFWPGPLTLLLQKHPSIPDLVTSSKPTVAVRVPNHLLTLSLLQQLNYPLAAPSANPFGCISPTTKQHVFEYFRDSLKLILDGGNCTNGIESTIIGFKEEEAILYRYGSISVEDIIQVIGEVKIAIKNDTSPDAPGMLSKHYAPTTKTILTKNIEEAMRLNHNKRIGLLLFTSSHLIFNEIPS